MPITTTFDADTWSESVIRMITEWLRDSNCFDSGSNAIANVVPYPVTDKSSVPIPRVELGIIGTLNRITGAGAQKANAVFKTVNIELNCKRSKDSTTTANEAERNLVRTTDIVDKYFRSANGYAKLGAAGLRKAKLEGPFPGNDKNYYSKRMLLTVEIEVV